VSTQYPCVILPPHWESQRGEGRGARAIGAFADRRDSGSSLDELSRYAETPRATMHADAYAPLKDAEGCSARETGRRYRLGAHARARTLSSTRRAESEEETETEEREKETDACEREKERKKESKRRVGERRLPS